MRRGSICWFDPAPTVGHEQMKRRPWVSVGPPDLARNGLLVLCPLTSSSSGAHDPKFSRFCVPYLLGDVSGPSMGEGFVLVHHVRSVSLLRIAQKDWTTSRLSVDVLGRIAAGLMDLASR